MKKLYLISNLQSGKNAIRGKLASVINLFTAAGYEVTVRTTQARMDACAAAEYACLNGGFDLIVCSGGDGTLNEVVQGLVHSQAPLPLGYIPCGSTNDFAKGLSIPSGIEEAAKWMIANPHVFQSDIGAFNGRYFLYVAAFGAFTSTVYETKQSVKNILGHLAYLLHGISILSTIRALHLCIEYEGNAIEGDFLFGMVTNAASVGGLLKLKDFQLDDGIFEVMLIRKPSNAVGFQRILYFLDHIDENEAPEDILYFRTDSIQFRSEEEISWTLDGEFGGSYCNTKIHNLQRAITFCLGEDGPCNSNPKDSCTDQEGLADRNLTAEEHSASEC